MRKMPLLTVIVILAAFLGGCSEDGNSAPDIVDVLVTDVAEASATIAWTTDEPASSQVEYGLTTSYGSASTLESSLVESHSVSLNGLVPDTTYHYRVKSADASHSESLSEDHTFTTLPDVSPPVISDVSATDVTESGAIIIWATDEPATSQVTYSTMPFYSSVVQPTLTPLDDNLVTDHRIEIGVLSAGTVYHCTVISKDDAGNEATSGDHTFTTSASTNAIVTFSDSRLESAIRGAIRKPEGDIYPSDLESLTELDRPMMVTELNGLEYCTSLRVLNLEYPSQISDITPLEGLTNLTELRLWGEQLRDITPLESLTSLTELRLNAEQLSYITPLENLTNLETLSVFANQISDIDALGNLVNLTELTLYNFHTIDISPLENLTSLTYLRLSGDQIGDISPLENLTSLTYLELSGPISDVSPLEDLTSLAHLWLAGDQISDITPLENLTGLTELGIERNQISDISPLGNLTNLTELDIWRNQVGDITPLENLTRLEYLYANHNQIVDVSPLENLTSLTLLDLFDNEISDIGPLFNLTELAGLWLNSNQISDISPLANLKNLGPSNPGFSPQLSLRDNYVSDITPLVDNEGLSEGDVINITLNPLSADSINILIPQLEARGVAVRR